MGAEQGGDWDANLGLGADEAGGGEADRIHGNGLLACKASAGTAAKKDQGKQDMSSIPTSSISIDISVPLKQMEPRVIELCKVLFQRWSHLDDSRFAIEKVSGGITNLLLKVSVTEDNECHDAVTVRLYGPNTELVIDRQRELKALRHLSAAGFGAELLGIFDNGVVQSFIDAYTLTPQDMSNPKFAAKIAKELSRFHKVDIPGSKESQLWEEVLKFFKEAADLKFDDAEKQRRYDEVSFEEIHNEIFALKELTDLLNAPVVFAHNDLLSGNLMLSKDGEEKLYIIDFEYGSYSYRGYDIANHFNEYAGFECDYNLYPNKDVQFYFFRHYLQPDQPDKVASEDLVALYIETNSYRLASHLYWALWALIQASVSPIDFDYLGYFFLRYGEYKKQRDECFSVAQRHLSRLPSS